MRVLIVEDEQLSQDEVVRLISKHFSDYSICAQFGSIEESVEWLKNNTVDLIFMDIHLSDGVCFSIFEQINIETPIIFTTAYDSYAIRSFEVNGVGYLLKPLVEEKFVQAVRKFEKSITATYRHLLQTYNEQVQNKPHKLKNRFLVKIGDKIRYIPVEEIAYFVYEERYTYIVTFQGKQELIDGTLEQIEQVIDPFCFFRITRNCIASIKSINEVSKYFGGRLKVRLIPLYSKELLISRHRVIEFLRWLEQ